MKIVNVEQGSDEWLDYRKGKISGTMLTQMYSSRGTKKIGFYELIAERLAVPRDDEDRMSRGLRLEEEALELFTKKTKKKIVRDGIWVHDKYPDIIISPDAAVPTKKKGHYEEAVEVKCLSSARHLQAVIEDKVPSEFEAQMMQYFIVNTNLQNLYFVFYDPSVVSVPLHIIKVTRKELGDLPGKFLEFQLQQLEEVSEIIEKLAF